MLKINDIIHCEKYYEVCDYKYDDVKGCTSVLPSGIVCVDTGSIPEFFRDIKGNSQKYIVVSPRCDFGVCYQEENLPCFDLHKWAKHAISAQHGYNDLHMPARINKKRCNINHKYSIKCWSYTEATFDEIPENVIHWFVVNCDITDERVSAIPLGINGVDGNLEYAEKILNRRETCVPQNRDKLLYINFQFYNTERYELFKYFSMFPNNIVTCKYNTPFDEYINDLATHKFVLCPEGNGIDCYRTLESIYMGSIPIIKSCHAMNLYTETNYPIVTTHNMFGLSLVELTDIYNSILPSSFKIMEKCLWPYWKNIIEEKGHSLK